MTDSAACAWLSKGTVSGEASAKIGCASVAGLKRIKTWTGYLQFLLFLGCPFWTPFPLATFVFPLPFLFPIAAFFKS